MGGECELALPLGAMEEIARTAPKLESLYRRIIGGEWTLQEVRAVIDAAVKYSPDATGITLDALVEYEGWARVRELAVTLFYEAWLPRSERKNLDAPGGNPPGATEHSE